MASMSCVSQPQLLLQLLTVLVSEPNQLARLQYRNLPACTCPFHLTQFEYLLWIMLVVYDRLTYHMWKACFNILGNMIICLFAELDEKIDVSSYTLNMKLGNG